MTTSMVPRRSYADAQKMRRTLIEVHEVDPYRVTSTPNDELDRLLPLQLTLVPDVDTDPVAVMHTEVLHMPRITLVTTNDEQTPDELESTRYFLERIRRGPDAVIDLQPTCLGGDSFGGLIA